MKRVRCPKCKSFITFDETKYSVGQRLTFICPNCNKQFGIRYGVSAIKLAQKEENTQNPVETFAGQGNALISIV